MWAGALTRRTAGLPDAQIALRGLLDGQLRSRVQHKPPAPVSDFHHPNVVVRATTGAHSTPDARVVIDHDLAAGEITVDGAGGTADHAHRIGAVHARIRNHDIVDGGAVPDKARVVVVSGGARADAFVALNAPVQVDHHGAGAVYEPAFDHELQEAVAAGALVRFLFGCVVWHNSDRGRQEVERNPGTVAVLAEHVFFDQRGRNQEGRGVTNRTQSVLEGELLLVLPIVDDFVLAVGLPSPQITHRPVTATEPPRDPSKAGADRDESVGIMPLLGDDRFVFEPGRGVLLHELLVRPEPI